MRKRTASILVAITLLLLPLFTGCSPNASPEESKEASQKNNEEYQQVMKKLKSLLSKVNHSRIHPVTAVGKA